MQLSGVDVLGYLAGLITAFASGAQDLENQIGQRCFVGDVCDCPDESNTLVGFWNFTGGSGHHHHQRRYVAHDRPYDLPKAEV